MAQTINFLTDNNITDYETLVEKTKAATDRFHELSQQIRDLEKRMAEITELKMHIINYLKTKKIYSTYRESGYSERFYEANTKEILLHQSAKQAFSLLPAEQIPSMKNLQLEYKECSNVKKSLSADYKSVKSIMKQSVIIKNNVDLIMGASYPEGRKIERVL